MFGNEEHLQVVFLIDTRNSNKPDNKLLNNKTVDLSKSLSLSALKILQSLASLEGGFTAGTDEVREGVKSIRWGYKFFDSLKPSSAYRHRDFHDFNLTNFEKFEDELRNKFKNFSKQNESCSDSQSSSKSTKQRTTGLWSQNYAPADHLAVALCEIAQDFQWQAPDIMSPSRGSCSRLSEGSSSSTSVMTEKTNLTFLFMACPWNEEQLREFVKMRSNQITTNDLLDVVVHDDVRTDFLEKHHVKLIWFDTRIVASDKSCKLKKGILEIVQGMMSSINGHLIPLNAILNTGSEVTSSISDIVHVKESSHSQSVANEKPKTNDAKRFEHFNTVSNCMTVSSVMDYACRKARLLNQSLCKQSLITATLFTNKGAGYDRICSLKISILSQYTSSVFIGSVASTSGVSKSTAVKPTDQEESLTELKDGIDLTIKGSLNRDQLPLRYIQSKIVYCCIGVDYESQEEATNNQDVNVSSRFSSLMKQIGSNKKVLVVDVRHFDWLASRLAIMEPFTASAASLRLISPHSALKRQMILDTGINIVEKDNFDTNPISTFVKSTFENIEVKSKKTTNVGNEGDSFIGTQELDIWPFRPYQLEPWYKSAPSSGVNSQFINRLASIQAENRNNMASGLNEIMMNLRDLYCKDPAVLGNSTLPSSCDTRTPKAPSVVSNQKQNKKKKFTRAKSFGGLSSSRTGLILENSIKLQKNKSNELENKDGENKKEKMVEKDKPNVNINEILGELSGSDDVINHLKESYEKQLQQDSCPCLFAQTVVSITTHFMKVQQSDKDTIDETKKLIKDSLIMTNKQLREKYQKEDQQTSVEGRIREVFLQVVLQLEMEALSPTDIPSKCSGEGLNKKGLMISSDDRSDDSDKESELPDSLQVVVDEMVAMLQPIPFLADHNKLTMFLKEKLLPNYTETVPYMLVGIYEGLMQPVPTTLRSPKIEDLLSIPEPPSSSYGSVGSVEAIGSASSNRPRGLKRLPSIANIPTRTIAVDMKKNDKPKESGKRRVKKKPVENEAKKVRRNLFMGSSQEDDVEKKSSLTRRKSVAVMQTTQTWKSPRRSGKGCSRSGITLKTKTVKETPGKRQVLCAMLEKMERARQRQKDNQETLVQVIEESPIKPVPETDTKGTQSCPRIKVPSTLQRKNSFYSKANNKYSRNLAKALTLGARIRGGNENIPARKNRLTELSSDSKDSNKPKDVIVSESPSKFLFSEIFSPEKLQGIRKVPLVGEDSPSHNTRQQVTLTPIKQETTSQFKKFLEFSPVQGERLKTECPPCDGKLAVSPFKSPIGTPLRTPRKRRLSTRSHGSAEKSKKLEPLSSDNKEINLQEIYKKLSENNEATKSDATDSPSISNLKIVESSPNRKQLKVLISPKLKLETLDNWPRKKVRSGTPSPTAYKSPSLKGEIRIKPSPVWMDTHEKSPTFEKITPKSSASSSKKVRCTPRSRTMLTRSNSAVKKQQNVSEEKYKNPPKSRRRLPISRQAPSTSENIYCSFSSSPEDGDVIPFPDQLFSDEDCRGDVVGLISDGLDSDSDPEIDFPKQLHLNKAEIQNDSTKTLLTPNYGLRRKRSREDNSSEKPHKISRKKTPDFREAGNHFKCYQSGPTTRSSVPSETSFEAALCNTLQIPNASLSNRTPLRKLSRKNTQNMPSTSSAVSAFSSCGADLSCSEISNFSSIDGDEVFTEESPAHGSKSRSYRSPGGTPSVKHTPLSVRGLSQLLSSPLVSPSQKKALADQRRMSTRGTLLNFSPK